MHYGLALSSTKSQGTVQGPYPHAAGMLQYSTSKYWAKCEHTYMTCVRTLRPQYWGYDAIKFFMYIVIRMRQH